MFFISAPSGSLRGRHAHRNTNQFLVVAGGSVEISTEDPKGRKQDFLLEVGDGLHIPPLIWGTQIFHGPNALLVVLTDAPYDEADYIRDYEAFLALQGGREESSASP